MLTNRMTIPPVSLNGTARGRPRTSTYWTRTTSARAVEPARFLAGVVVLRALLAVAHGAEPIGADAAAREIVAHRVGAPLAERQVVLGRADVAGVPFDLDAQVGVLLQRPDRLVEGARGLRPQRVAVEVEVHVLEDELLARRLDDLDGDVRRRPCRRAVVTCTVSCTGPACIGAVHGVSRSFGLVSVPVGADQR
jgi:hypothetical protein